ncbi:Long_chain fatty acid CoA ligase [Hexamita inflata]|uniref:Long_chain fatty acid CoA ligase n=1 Tax=Hexamita inflata TaxID=28002 RepID=A0ABP1HP70_9EUKA
MQTFDCSFNAPTLTVPESRSTFPKSLRTTSSCHPNRRFLGTREFFLNGKRGAYEWYSYQDIDRMSCLLSQGLTEIGLKRGDRAGIISQNRTEWTVVDLACSISGIVLVPIYDTQSAEDIQYVCQDAELKICFSSLDMLDKIKAVHGMFETVVVFDDRVDDRAIIQQLDQKLIPTNICFQPRCQEIFDEFDKEEGIYDPAPSNKTYPKLNDGYSNQICRLQRNQSGFFKYKLDDQWVTMLTKSKQQIDTSFISYTFWKLIQIGYDKFFSQEFNQLSYPYTVIPVDVHVTKPDSLLSLVYTSGTTGKPKGVMLTQENVIWTGFSLNQQRFIKEDTPINSLRQPMRDRQDFMLSYLPLAHIYMRLLQGVQIINGGGMGYIHGSVSTLFEDIKELRATIFILVPRIVQKIYDGITSKIEKQSALKQKIFQLAFNNRLKTFKKYQQAQNNQLLVEYNENQNSEPVVNCKQKRMRTAKLFDPIFKQFPEMLGGRCRIFVSASAPLAQAHGEFVAACFNMHTLEAYGMTETGGHGTAQEIDTLTYGAIGKGVDNNTQIRIMSIPEMGYTVNDERIVKIGKQQQKAVCPRGELMIKGPSVFKGYFKDQIKTDESFIDGYFATGDIAEFNPITKEISIIDRKRGIVKLSQGEFISVSHIEDVISKSKFVESVFLYANRFHSFTLAIVVPNEQYLCQKGFNKDENISRSSLAIKMLTEDVKMICKEYQLKSFEIPKVVIIESEPWTPENGLLTPGLKIKRPACKAKYEALMLQIIHKLNKCSGNVLDKQIEQVIQALDESPNVSDNDSVSCTSGVR